MGGACNGNFLGIGADMVAISVLIEATQPYGLAITNGEFTAFQPPPTISNLTDTPTTVLVSPGYKNSPGCTNFCDVKVSFVNCAFWGPNDFKANVSAAVSNGSVVDFKDSIFLDWAKEDKLAHCIVASAGSITVSGCEFRRDAPQVLVGHDVQRAIITGNLLVGKQRISVEGGPRSTVVVANNVAGGTRPAAVLNTAALDRPMLYQRSYKTDDAHADVAVSSSSLTTAPPLKTDGDQVGAVAQSTNSTPAKICFDLPGQPVRVTVVAVDPAEPTWIVAHIAFGAAFVDGETSGCVFWNGLDDNLWPVPTGSYALKGIVTNATKWAADGKYHSVVAEYIGSITPFNVSVDAPADKQKMFVDGDPVGASFTTVATAVNFKGREQFANFYHGCECNEHKTSGVFDSTSLHSNTCDQPVPLLVASTMVPARRNALLPTRAATSAALSTGTQDGGCLPIHAVTKRAIVAGLVGAFQHR